MIKQINDFALVLKIFDLSFIDPINLNDIFFITLLSNSISYNYICLLRNPSLVENAC